ncbi:MAG: ion channel [Candidatus Bathyarchaeota archaeon]|nr:ion channel [Candidatus Bathyarchaeota archaeon]
MSAVLIVAGVSIKQERIIGPITLLIVSATLVIVWIFTIQGSLRSEELARFFTTVSFSLIGALIFINIINTARKRALETDFIWGGVATYLLIGLSFASVYRLVEISTPGSFLSASVPPRYDFSSFIYFSYYSLTTIGGLMTPNTLQAQSLVMLEPIIGTLFIAIFISRLIGVVGNKQTESPKEKPLSAAE